MDNLCGGGAGESKAKEEEAFRTAFPNWKEEENEVVEAEGPQFFCNSDKQIMDNLSSEV